MLFRPLPQDSFPVVAVEAIKSTEKNYQHAAAEHRFSTGLAWKKLVDQSVRDLMWRERHECSSIPRQNPTSGSPYRLDLNNILAPTGRLLLRPLVIGPCLQRTNTHQARVGISVEDTADAKA